MPAAFPPPLHTLTISSVLIAFIYLIHSRGTCNASRSHYCATGGSIRHEQWVEKPPRKKNCSKNRAAGNSRGGGWNCLAGNQSARQGANRFLERRKLQLEQSSELEPWDGSSGRRKRRHCQCRYAGSNDHVRLRRI